MLEDQATIKYQKGQKVDIGNGEITMHVDIYQHQTIVTEGNSPLMIWIGSKEDAKAQIEDITKSAGYTIEQQNFLKYCPNVEKLQLLHPEVVAPTVAATATTPTSSSSSEPKKQAYNIPAAETAGFSIKDIKLGERYE